MGTSDLSWKWVHFLVHELVWPVLNIIYKKPLCVEVRHGTGRIQPVSFQPACYLSDLTPQRRRSAKQKRIPC